MTRKQRRISVIAGLGVVLALALGLILFALRDQIVFFYSPTEIHEKQVAAGTPVRLGGLVKADLLVLEVAGDYSWALIGEPRRKLAWVFAREPRMDDARLDELRARFTRWGYDPAQLQRVPQFPDQLR